MTESTIQKSSLENITLNDILNLTNEELKNTKIRFMVSSQYDDPHKIYINNPEIITKDWFLWEQEKQGSVFQEGNIALGFLRIGCDRWLFVTAQKILKNFHLAESGVNYETEEIQYLKKFFGRVIINFHNTSQNMCRWAEGLIKELQILEILPVAYEGIEFPGYENVSISWQELDSIISNQKQDWITALKNQKGVYLITDKNNGKLYVGSAYGENMLLQRWSCYQSSGHGGNVELRNLSFDYIKENFQYSILETYNSTTSDDRIIAREVWWKNALKSREFGYNAN